MPKRQKKVKLTKQQVVDNDTNRWLAKKDAAIAQLCKAMAELKVLERRQRRLSKMAASEQRLRQEQLDKLKVDDSELLAEVNGKTRRKASAKDVGRLEREPSTDNVNEVGSVVTPGGRARRMEAMGFRRRKKGRDVKAETAASS